MKHVRLVIDEVVWYDGIPEELNIQQSEGTLVLKLGAKRPQQQLGNIFGRRQTETAPKRPEPIGEYVPPVPDNRPPQ